MDQDPLNLLPHTHTHTQSFTQIQLHILMLLNPCIRGDIQ